MFLETGFEDTSRSEIEMRIAIAGEMHQELKSLELENVLASSDLTIKANYKTGVGSIVQFSVTVAEDDPHRISELDYSIVKSTSRGEYTDVTTIPDGPLRKRIQRTLAVINSNDVDLIRQYIKDETSTGFQNTDSLENLVRRFQKMYESSSALEFYAIREYETATVENEVVVILRNNLTLGWNAIVFQYEPDHASRIAEIKFATARPPENLAPELELSDAELVTEVVSYLRRLEFGESFSGSVLIARNGKALHRQAMGLACRRFNVPNEINTKFNLGSMNKMFTGVAVMQLVQQGLLSLDDPLAKFLPEDWLPESVSSKIKIRHLLTHTSGLGSYFNAEFENSPKGRFRDLRDYRLLVKGDKPAFEPGTEYKYSNTGMLLLGVVIEKASGEDYFTYIRDNIYEPAGMLNSDCYEMDRPIPDLATGYFNQNGHWKNNNYLHVLRGGPAGGGFSTVDDLWRFSIALRTHQLLDEQHMEMTWSVKPEFNSPNYGYGFSVQVIDGDRVVGHSGGFPGINSQLDIYLDSGFTVAVMSNTSDGATPIANALGKLIARVKQSD